MSRLAQNLLYLTIYNPTLRPSEPIVGDEDDAREQAHILFYTSKDRAVSRDRMLRQVGLAKALVNFSEMFNADMPCTDVHSQSRRMVMVSPEPDFWIHACAQVARTPRSSGDKGKGKSKEKAKPSESSGYEYHEASVHDLALRADILRGYERFKLTHGSFTSILANVGQQALELQLERFFTVWAWSWDLEDGIEFEDHLGVPLHPMYQSMLPLLDSFAAELSDTTAAIIITPNHVVPSTRFTRSGYPAFLAHLLSSLLIPPKSHPSIEAPDDTLKPNRSATEPSKKDDGGKSFLGMSNVDLDVRKWKWPGYLTFGKSPGRKPSVSFEGVAEPEIKAEMKVGDVDYDKSALEDAFSSDTVSVSESATKNNHSETSKTPTIVPRQEQVAEADSSSETLPPREFLSTIIHLADSQDILQTRRQKVFYILNYPFLLALVGTDEKVTQSESVVQRVINLFSEFHDIMSSSTTSDLPSAEMILQPKDRSIISIPNYSIADDKFSSSSVHLYNAQQLLEKNPDFQEVFSRGQAPQHWHVGKRGLNGENGEEAKLYLEVFRKEASLTDVDNALAGSVTRQNVL